MKRAHFILICMVIMVIPSLCSSQVVKQFWHKVTLDSANGICNMSFADTSVGYIGVTHNNTYRWYRTIDGGKHWDSVKFSGIEFPENYEGVIPWYLSTPSPNTAYFELHSNLGYIWTIATTDTGKTFHFKGDQKLIAEYSRMLTPQFGYYFSVQPNYLSYTMDSANSYSAATYDPDIDRYFHRTVKLNRYNTITRLGYLFDYSDSSHLLMTAPTLDSFLIFTSSDAGASWTKQLFNTGLNGRYGVFGKTAFLKGTPNVWLNPNATSFFPHIVPVAFYYSTDYGNSWNMRKSPVARIGEIAPVGKTTLWVTFTHSGRIGEDTRTKEDVLGFTTDNGLTWELDSTSMNGYSITHLQFLDSNHGWALGNRNGEVALFRYSYFEPQESVKDVAFQEESLQFTSNPASQQTTVSLSNEEVIKSVQMYNMLGKEIIVKHTPQQRSCTIATASLPNGIYLLKISTANGIVMGKLQVSHY